LGKSKWFQKMTSELAWQQYVDEPVEFFISMFHYEWKGPVTDIKEMCRIYARDMPGIFSQLFTQDQLNHVAKLLEQYICDYIQEKGGLDRLKLYTNKELEEIEDKITDTIKGVFN
jgi:hypothetical protein